MQHLMTIYTNSNLINSTDIKYIHYKLFVLDYQAPNIHKKEVMRTGISFQVQEPDAIINYYSDK